jgi:hypothetical protein
MSCHGINQGVMGTVVRRWEEAGRPDWSLEITIEEVKRTDAELYRDGLGKIRHRRLRQHIEHGDEEYVRRWILGCHFCWLNPRNPPCPICGQA